MSIFCKIPSSRDIFKNGHFDGNRLHLYRVRVDLLQHVVHKFKVLTFHHKSLLIVLSSLLWCESGACWTNNVGGSRPRTAFFGLSCCLGKTIWTKFDKFSENFQTASDPPSPPYFRKTMLRFFREAQKFATKFIRIGVTPTPFSENSLFYPPKISEKP